MSVCSPPPGLRRRSQLELREAGQDGTGQRHQSKREKTAGGGLGPPESSCLTGSQEQECQSSASECLVASDGRLFVM